MNIQSEIVLSKIKDIQTRHDANEIDDKQAASELNQVVPKFYIYKGIIAQFTAHKAWNSKWSIDFYECRFPVSICYKPIRLGAPCDFGAFFRHLKKENKPGMIFVLFCV